MPISADWSCVVSFYIDKKMKTNFANILLSIYHKMRMSKKNSNTWNPYLGVFYTIANCTRTLTILHCSKSCSIWTKNKKKLELNLHKYCFYYTPSYTEKNLNITWTWCFGIFLKIFLFLHIHAYENFVVFCLKATFTNTKAIYILGSCTSKS